MISAKQGALLTFLSCTALYSYWLYKIQEDKHSPINQQLPDMYIEQLTLKETNNLGIVKYQIHAQQLTHIPANNQMQLRFPQMTLYQTDQPTWEISANHGTTRSGLDDIHLWGNVQATQVANKQHTEIILLTDNLYCDNKQRTALTNDKVTMLTSNGKVVGHGMQLQLQEKVFTLLAGVKGIYEPRQP